MKINVTALKKGMALLCIAGCFSFSNKNETVPGKANVQGVTDTLINNEELVSTTPVSLRECPFPSTDIFIQEEDMRDWDHNSIQKCTYRSSAIVSYFIKNNMDGLKTLVIFYNPAENRQLKMVITGKKTDGGIRYRLASVRDILHFEITIRDEKEGYNAIIGKPLDLASLGNYVVYNPGKIAPPCTGFQSCMECRRLDCEGSWVCSILCGPAGVFCLVSWALFCSVSP